MLLISILMFTISLSGALIVVAKADAGSARAVLDSFLEKAAGQVTSVEVYYLDWDTLTRVAVTESALRDRSWDCKVIIRRPIGDHLHHMEEPLRKLRLEPVKEGLDLRLGYVFRSKNKELLSLCFANNLPAVTINGASFRASAQLLSSVLPLLPHEAYKETYEAIIRSWVSSSWALDGDESDHPKQERADED
jgi:hypothetical protein